jgi:hypothetical protein
VFFSLCAYLHTHWRATGGQTLTDVCIRAAAGKVEYLNVRRGQSDQMSLWKSRPKCSPTHF